jgi:hypothetical protein
MTKFFGLLLVLASVAAVSACAENNTLACGSVPYHTSCAP